jgi:hypothetical protein
MKTIITYQSYGYGPVMKVIKFLNEAQELRANEEVMLIAAKKDRHIIETNKQLYADVRIVYLSTDGDIASMLSSLAPINKIIAFYDFESIVWGYFNNVTTRIAIDGLFHSWLIDVEMLEQQKALVDFYKKQSFEYMKKLSDKLLSNDPHQAIIWMHYFATHSLLGNYKGATKKAQEFQKHDLLHCAGYFDFMPLPKEMVEIKQHKQHNVLLVSLGGGRYPIMTLDDEKTYYKLALLVVEQYIAALSKDITFTTKIVTVHPDLYSVVLRLLRGKDYIVLKSTSMQEYAHMLGLARLVIAAPGNTAVFEAAHYGKPVFLLPEKHTEQFNFVNLVGDTFIHASLFKHLRDSSLALSSEHQSVRMIIEVADKLSTDKNIMLVNKQQIAKSAPLSTDQKYIDRQRARLQSIYGRGNGTQQLVEAVAGITE